MTLLSRRKRRTTARRTTPATLAAKLAALAALVATPALAQPPPAGYQPPGYSPSSYQPLNYQANGGQPAGYQPLNYQSNGSQPPAGGQQSGFLPLPPGYRPRTPPPQAQARPAAPPSGGTGAGGQVMYFQKPADALTATGGSDSAGAVAQADVPNAGAVPVPDVPAPALPAPPSRSLSAPGGLDRPLTPAPVAVTTSAYGIQPKPGEPNYVPPATPAGKGYKPVPSEFIQLPARGKIFQVYDDAQLERAIMERLISDLIKVKRESLKAETDPKKKEEIAKSIDELIVTSENPTADSSYRFPALPVVSPPGVAYQPKTPTYEPHKLIVEPGYYVHRRLHLEEKNAERIGWDLGPMQTLVSAAYFWRDTLLLPQSLASASVYGRWDTSAGKCLPGSTAPYYLYPLGVTVTGTVAEGIFITGLGFIFK